MQCFPKFRGRRAVGLAEGFSKVACGAEAALCADLGDAAVFCGKLLRGSLEPVLVHILHRRHMTECHETAEAFAAANVGMGGDALDGAFRNPRN